MSGYYIAPKQSLAFPPKDPSDILPYGMDFSAQMGKDGDSLSSLTSITADVVIAPAGITVGNLAITFPTLQGNVATCLIAGGTVGVTYRIHFLVGTTAGHTYDRSGILPVLYR